MQRDWNPQQLNLQTITQPFSQLLDVNVITE